MVVRIGLPKGVVLGESHRTIKRILDVTPEKNRLSFIHDHVHCYLFKHRDIPHLVKSGLIDIGVTSTEWLAESELDSFIIQKKLDWCDTRISFIGPVDNEGLHRKMRIATEFPNITKKYARDKNLDVENIYKLSGSTEALIPNIFPFGVECIETGETLRANGLIELEKLMDASIVVITNREHAPELVPYLELIRDRSEAYP